jgi:hypothetical protein
VDLNNLFPGGPFEFRMGLKRGDASTFFQATAARDDILAERRFWLAREPDRYVGVVEGSRPVVTETISLLESLGTVDVGSERPVDPSSDPRDQLLRLGSLVEPDLLMLQADRDGDFKLLAACVCFPTFWKPTEKLGLPMAEIHGPPPGLHAGLGRQIATFLAHLRPNTAWLRSNWGLSASPERNQHPERQLPRLNSLSRLETAWLRVERQALIRLPETSGVLFAIRLEIERLDRIKEGNPDVAEAIASALETMSPAIADYKGVDAAPQLTTLLRA